MSNYTLGSPKEGSTLSSLAGLFATAPDHRLALAIQEDTSCQHAWIPIGSVTLRPGPNEEGDEPSSALETALRFGFFEWEYPQHDELLATAHAVIDGASAAPRQPAAGKDDPVRRALEHLACVAARVGLVSPNLDAKLMSGLPFRRPTTLVMDTSAILQGGLDFAVRFLCPAARIRVPAVVHMEFLSQTDNYFKIRRGAGGGRARALLARVCGVGGQRALIRVELSNDVEIERATVGADPLRGIVRIDEEEKNLHLEHVQRSFADRLIFETAREHQARCSPGHRVMLMTADEGLCRMTIGEGMGAFLVRAPKPEALSGAVLTGTNFRPFGPELHAVPLPSLLWELAGTFGAVRLASADQAFEVRAIGNDLPWQPYHTLEDLLWVSLGPLAPPVAPASTAAHVAPPSEPARAASGGPKAKAASASKSRGRRLDADVGLEVRDRTGAYKFSVKRMIRLISALAAAKTLSTVQALSTLEIEKESGLTDYRGFLVKGGFVEASTHELRATGSLVDLWAAWSKLDVPSIRELLERVPSLKSFFDHLKAHRHSTAKAGLPVTDRALATYIALAEVCQVGLSIPDDGVYATDAVPTVAEFAAAAWSAYSALARGEDFVSTGAWLEALARDHAVHPVAARALLEDAFRKKLLDRFVEGSTPDTRYEKHSFWMLTGRPGAPDVEQIKLYHGDFLMPERASVSLRLVKKGAV